MQKAENLYVLLNLFFLCCSFSSSFLFSSMPVRFLFYINANDAQVSAKKMIRCQIRIQKRKDVKH